MTGSVTESNKEMTESNKQRRGEVVQRVMEPGITISLLGTESTGFSPVGRLMDQIIDGLREREAAIDIMEDSKHGEESKNGLGCCGDTAMDKRMPGAGVRAGARARCGGLVSDTLPLVVISGKGDR